MSKDLIGGINVAGWTNEQKNELLAALDIEAEARKLDAELSAAKNAPDAIIAAKREEAELARRDARDAKAIADAEAKYGKDRVGYVRTRLGALVMLCPTKEQDDRFTSEYAAQKKDLPDPASAEYSWLQNMKSLCLHPDPKTIDKMAETIPRFDNVISNLYSSLVMGLDERILGK